MLKIGYFSKLSRISIRMLRHYDEIGLLVPKSIDPFTGYRYYGEDQLPTAGKINALKEMGFGLAAIEEILRNYDNPQALAEFLQIKQREIQADADEAQRRLQLLETAIERLRKDDKAMNYAVSIKTIPQRYVASLREVIPAYDQEGILWEKMCVECAPQNVLPDENGFALAVFHDEGYKEGDVDVEIQSMVKGEYKDTEHVVFKTEPPVQIASATYKGSYDQLTLVHQAVASWVNDNGYEFNGPMFCIYHVSPAMAATPEEQVTEVCYPVTKK